MRRFILQKIRNTPTGVFTGIAIVLSVALTTSLNALFSWIAGTGIKPITILFATMDAILIPAIIAPLMINFYKRAANIEDVNQQLQIEIAERQRAEQATQQRSAQLQAINELALECAAAPPDVDLPRLIADRFRCLTGARAVSISTYDPFASELIIRYISVDGAILNVFNTLLGRNIIGMANPVSPEMLQDMLTCGIAITDSISEVTFGAIPKSFDLVVKSTFGPTYFTAMALCFHDQLWGTAVAASQADQPPLEPDLARTFASIAAVAMQRQNAERALRQRQEQLQAIVASLPLIFFVLDAQGIFQVSEGNGLTTLGLKPGEVVGRSALHLYQDMPKIVESLQRALAGEITHAIHDMGWVIYEVYYTQRKDEVGRPDGVHFSFGASCRQLASAR